MFLFLFLSLFSLLAQPNTSSLFFFSSPISPAQPAHPSSPGPSRSPLPHLDSPTGGTRQSSLSPSSSLAQTQARVWPWHASPRLGLHVHQGHPRPPYKYLRDPLLTFIDRNRRRLYPCKP